MNSFNELKSTILEAYTAISLHVNSAAGLFKIKDLTYDPGELISIYIDAAEYLLSLLSNLDIYEEEPSRLADFQLVNVTDKIRKSSEHLAEITVYNFDNVVNTQAIREASAWINVIQHLTRIRKWMLRCSIRDKEESK